MNCIGGYWILDIVVWLLCDEFNNNYCLSFCDFDVVVVDD
jgi:hypothetical protein